MISGQNRACLCGLSPKTPPPILELMPLSVNVSVYGYCVSKFICQPPDELATCPGCITKCQVGSNDPTVICLTPIPVGIFCFLKECHLVLSYENDTDGFDFGKVKPCASILDASKCTIKKTKH